MTEFDYPAIREQVKRAIDTFDIRYLVIALHVFEDAMQEADEGIHGMLLRECENLYKGAYPDGRSSPD